MTPKQPPADYSTQEATQRRDAALRAALSMASIPHAESSPRTKKKPLPRRRLRLLEKPSYEPTQAGDLAASNEAERMCGVYRRYPLALHVPALHRSHPRRPDCCSRNRIPRDSGAGGARMTLSTYGALFRHLYAPAHLSAKQRQRQRQCCTVPTVRFSHEQASRSGLSLRCAR